jgi:hypothetical protein
VRATDDVTCTQLPCDNLYAFMCRCRRCHLEDILGGKQARDGGGVGHFRGERSGVNIRGVMVRVVRGGQDGCLLISMNL